MGSFNPLGTVEVNNSFLGLVTVSFCDSFAKFGTLHVYVSFIWHVTFFTNASFCINSTITADDSFQDYVTFSSFDSLMKDDTIHLDGSLFLTFRFFDAFSFPSIHVPHFLMNLFFYPNSSYSNHHLINFFDGIVDIPQSFP